MTNRQTLTQRPDTLRPHHPQSDPPTPHAVPRGFLDCRGEWQALDESADHDAAS